MMKLNIQRFSGTCTVTATEINSDVANNTSQVKAHVKLQTSGATYNNSGSAYYTIKMYKTSDNSLIYDSGKKKFNISKNSTKEYDVTSTAIEHNADGSYSNVKVNLYVSFTSTTTNSATTTITMATIPRASTFASSVNTVTLGNSVVFTITRANNNFTHTLRYGDTYVGTIATNVGTSYTWSTPTNLLTNDMSKTVVIYCDTIYNNEIIGTTSLNINMNTPSYTPSISISLYDENSTTRNWGVYVKGKSRMRATITASTSYGGAISNFGLRMASSGDYTLYNANTNVFYPSINSNGVIYAKVIDTRNQSNTTNTTYTYADYDTPKITTNQVQRCDEYGNIDDNGGYCYIDFDANISSCNNKNKTNTTYKIRYKLTSASTYTEVTVGSNANSISYHQIFKDSNNQKISFSTTDEYDFQFYVKDTLSNAITIDQVVDTAFDLLNFNDSGKAMAIGKVSEASANQELLEINLPTTFIKNIETADIDAGDVTCDSLSSTSLSGTTITGGLVSGTTGSFNNLAINNINILMPYTLYNNASGESGDVTLSDSAANYTYLEVFFWHSDDSTKMSHKIYSPNNSNFQAVGNYDNGTYLYVATAYYSISGTSISKTSETRWRIAAGGTNTTRTANTTNILIYRVVGYK